MSITQDPSPGLTLEEHRVAKDYMNQACSDCGHTCGENYVRCEEWAKIMREMIEDRNQS